MSSPHTPGPWMAAEIVKSIRIDGARLLRPVDHQNFEHGAAAYIAIGSCEGDTRLIAAAPELLAALQQLTAYAATFTQDKTGWKKLDAARAAISKATGETT